MKGQVGICTANNVFVKEKQFRFELIKQQKDEETTDFSHFEIFSYVIHIVDMNHFNFTFIMNPDGNNSSQP